MRILPQARAPLRKNRRNLVVVFLADELIMAGFGLPEHIRERVRSAIVRQQMELAVERARIAAARVVSGRQGKGAEAGGKQY